MLFDFALATAKTRKLTKQKKNRLSGVISYRYPRFRINNDKHIESI